MTTPFKNNYAFGLRVETFSGHTKISHGGSIDGFSTQLEYYPDDKLTVIVLANVEGGASPLEGRASVAIANKLAALVHAYDNYQSPL